MNIILLNSSLILFAASIASHAGEAPSKTLDDFKKTQAAGSWMSVNDGVMGGLSRGGPQVSKEHKLVFKGEISLENNGGFSSIRTRGKKLDLSGYDGLEIKVKGDGRMYYLTARASGRRMLAFWSPVQPSKGEWAVIRIPFDAFYATYMGKKIPVMKLNTKNVTSVGLMLYDKKAGSFVIEADYIKAYKNTEVD
jgi:NADH dehydrogenase [ubiquinone] 1 alpha subcomplex assembly factor 1